MMPTMALERAKRDDSAARSSFQRTPWQGLAAVAGCVAILLIVVGLVFGQALQHEFLVWDDLFNVPQNPYLNPLTLENIAHLWRHPYGGLYIPLTYSFWATEALIARGFDPAGGSSWAEPVVFHAGNLVLHAGCVLLVFVLLRRLLGHDGAACAGALVFTLHPLQVESVAWITETKGLLSTFWGLAAIYWYLRSRRPRSALPPSGTGEELIDASQHRPHERTKPFPYLVATGCFVLAMLSKPSAVAVPLIVVLLDVGANRSRMWPAIFRMAPWFALAACFAVVTKTQQADEVILFVSPWWSRPLLATDAIAFYLYKLAVPLNLSADYGRSPQKVIAGGWLYWTWLGPVIVVLGISLSRHRRIWLTSLGIFVAGLSPVLGLVPFSYQDLSTVADRYTYLPMFGLALAVAWYLASCGTRLRYALFAPLLVAFAVLSFVQASYWRNTQRLFEHVLSVNPDSFAAYNNLGFDQMLAGNLESAAAWYQRSLEANPDHAEAHINLAGVLPTLGRWDEAYWHAQRALAIQPRSAIIHSQVGHLLLRKQQYDQAAYHYRRAAALEPHSASADFNMGTLLVSMGQVEEGIQILKRTIQAQPHHADAHHNLGLALSSLGRTAEAKHHLQQALRIRPNLASAHNTLGVVLAREGRLSEALDHFAKAVELDPHHAEAKKNLRATQEAFARRDRAPVDVAPASNVLDMAPEPKDSGQGDIK